MSRILLSVLLFAGAFTSLLDGRLDSVRILAQKVRTGWVLIKRFPHVIDDMGWAALNRNSIAIGEKSVLSFSNRLVSQ